MSSRGAIRVVLASLALAGCLRSWEEARTIGSAGDPFAAPYIAVASNGEAVVAWKDGLDQVDGDLWAVRRDPGNGWSAPERIGHGRGPRVAVDPSGSALAVWSEGVLEASRIWASRYRPWFGWSPAEMLSNQWVSNVDVAMDGEGNGLAVFDVPDGIAARWNRGVSWSDPEVVDTVSGSGPRVFMNAAGDAFASWTRIRSDGADDFLYYDEVSRREPSGVWSPPQNLGGNQAFPATVTVDRGGNAIAFWTEQNSGLWMRRFSAATGWAEARQLAPIASSMVAAGDADGDAAVVFEYIDDEIRAVRIADGEPGEIVTIASPDPSDPTTPYRPDVAAAAGAAIAVWQTDTRIEVSRGDASGWDPPEVLDEGAVAYPRVGMTGSGGAIATWRRGRADGDGVDIRVSLYR